MISMSKRIAILCSDDAHHKYLISYFRSKFNVLSVVIEPGKKQRERSLKNRRYKDYAYSQYHYLRRSLLGLNAYRRAYFHNHSPELGEVTYVDSINDPKVETVLSNANPDVTVVMGTSILSKKILKVAGPNIINVHGGYLPYYRGNHCFFFAVYERAFDRIGSTIHFVDEGIDTGQIIEIVEPSIYPDDKPESLYCRAELIAIHRLAELIEQFNQGVNFPSFRTMEQGTLYRTRDRKPVHDIQFWWWRKTGKLMLPYRKSSIEERFSRFLPEISGRIGGN
ncbi:hypothetical protein D2Q93_06250 [Alicyclobacillaceae bacterium I2511]|nr:hypothetical protein D2Q93_06250 [Alicyclobacillaceae bacterium I2511]